jgi:serine-type D-Ala-D-Ala carboxypeptidase/endopeptidase (penicillin-binding protein 4)
MYYRTFAWLALLGLYFLTLTCAQNTKKPLPTDKPTAILPQEVGELIEKFVQDSAMHAGFVGLSVRENNTQKELLSYQAGKMFNLASCQKAITTATALELLGEDFKFKTELQTDNSGNLYLKGYGDPTLASHIMANAVPSLDNLMQTFLSEIKAKGIKSIHTVIADETAWNYDVMPSHWIWSDMGNYFGAPAYALNVGDNSYELSFRPTQVGKLATLIGTQPTLPEAQFIHEVRTAPAGTGDQASIAGGSYEAVRYVSGTIPMDFQTFSIKGAMPDPPYYLAWYLTKMLRSQGITVKNEPTTSRRLALGKLPISTDRQVIYTHYSPSLRLICDYVNLYSVNLFAEAILKQLGATFPTNKPDNTPLRAGITVLKSFWEKRGIERLSFYMLDGSGLSVNNGITPSQMSLLLCEAQKLPTARAFYLSLPVAGISGTMKGVGAGTKLHNNLRAKTGGMSQILAYSGYFKGVSGKAYSFCLATNRYTGKGAYIQQRLTEIMESMVLGL